MMQLEEAVEKRRKWRVQHNLPIEINHTQPDEEVKAQVVAENMDESLAAVEACEEH